jgi:hypothetical protein
MSSMTVSVRGAEGIEKVLKKWLEPELDKQLDAAAKKSALLYARELRTALRPVSKRMACAVRVHRARKEKPAWVVGSSRKVAFFWPFVLDGTRDHGPKRAKALYFYGKDGKTHRPLRVRGVKANPVVDRVGKAAESRAMAEADTYLGKNT